MGHHVFVHTDDNVIREPYINLGARTDLTRRREQEYNETQIDVETLLLQG